MRCRQIVASTVIAVLMAGCESQHLAVASDPTPLPVAPRDSSAGPVRSQKPDRPPVPIRQSVFEAVPEAFPAMNNCEVAVRIRAHVNGVPVFDDEVREICYPALVGLSPQLSESDRAAKQAEIFRDGLQQIIDREVVLQDAFARLSKNGQQFLDKLKSAASKEFDKNIRSWKARSGAKTDDEFKNLLRNQGQSLEGIRRQFERNFMAREYMRSMVFTKVERATGHQEILDYYRDHPGDFQAVDSVKWQDIFIDAGRYRTREEALAFAEQLANRARAGEDFAKLSKYDNGDSSYRNGEGFGQLRGEIKPIEAEPILFRMKDGEVGPVIEIPTGYHVVRLLKRQQAGLIPLNEKTQEEIRRKLQMAAVERETKRLMAELRHKATIEVETHTP
jgi:parvulin-like peptidyl-prolyl isomerase